MKISKEDVQNIKDDKGNTTMPKKHPHAQSGHPAHGDPNPSKEGHPVMEYAHSLSKDADISQYFAAIDANPLANAFKGRIFSHPDVPSKKLDQEEIQARAETLSHQKRSGKTVVYVNIPYCQTHCLYCGFYNKPFTNDFSKSYTDTLIKEIEMWADREIYTSAPIHAIYFGGGTPTALDAADLERILLSLKKHLPLANDCEITVEGRLYNFDEDKIEACFRGGANRFSLGVQTFDTKIRKKMGRIADKETAIKQIERLQSYDQAAVIIDLIYGFPDQTMEVWKRDLETAMSLKLDGFDCYQLKVFGTTPLGKAIAEGKISEAADITKLSQMYKECVDTLTSNFYRRLSLSHWGRTSRERNLYNLYTKGVSSGLCFGAGAGGGVHGHFMMNNNNVEAWSEMVLAGKKPYMFMQEQSENSLLYKSIAEYMEQGFINFVELEKSTQLDIKDIVEPIINQWQEAGLIIKNENSIKTTLAGEFWQVNLTQMLQHRVKCCIEK